jgi:ABC-type branched-subunit amino acid transport system substrate-binding protein
VRRDTFAGPSPHRQGGNVRKRRGLQNGAVALVAGVLTTVGLAGMATSGGAAAANETGVTDKEITVGYIFSETGVAGSTFKNAGKAFQARIDRANAEGGVNGRKIVTEIVDDGGAVNNLQASQDLVRNRDVFAVVNNSSFGFLSYRFFLEQGVPMIGGGFDGTYYGEPGNEDIISTLGNIAPVAGVTNDGVPKVMKRMGAKKVAALAYGASASSSAAAQNLQKYAVPSVGLEAVYTNANIDFGTTDVGPQVLAMKNAGADAVYLPLVAASNLAVLTNAAQNGLQFKSAVLATGYGQDFLDQAATQVGPEVRLQTTFAPVELRTKATKQLQADLKKYAGDTGVPDFGQYTGYVTGDLLVKGLEAAGDPPTRRGLIDGIRAMGTYDQAGLACNAVDVSAENYGTPPAEGCAWYVGVEDGKFVPGKPVNGRLIEESTQATTTTTAAG